MRSDLTNALFSVIHCKRFFSRSGSLAGRTFDNSFFYMFNVKYNLLSLTINSSLFILKNKKIR